MPATDLDDAVAEEMLRMHVTSTPPIIVATLANASLVCFLLRGGVEPAWALNVWWCAFVLLMGVRHAASKAWMRDAARRQRNRLWERRFALIVGLGGVMWGLPGTLLYPTAESGLQPISALVQMGVSAAAVMSLTSVQLIYRSFFLAMMVPSSAWLLTTGGHIERLTALALGLFTLLLLVGGKRAGRSLEEGVRLRYQLAEALGTAEVARQTAEHAHAAKTTFLTNMSHELRTPLHGILSFAAMGLERAPDSRMQQYFSRIRHSGERLHRLINDLLEVSHASQATLDATAGEIRAVDLRSLLSSLVSRRQDQLDARGLRVSTKTSGEPRSVSGMYLPLERLFDHVLSNAIRYARPDTEIRFDLHWKETELEVVVADQGVGIPEGELESIFEQFTQSSRTRSNAGGTGLGLSIARQIARQHGGDIVARNNSDGGADFIVRLPCSVQA
ncbi:HAMP domain-containing sensor histidine kinase [Viridibacterium curvum]|uniref:histidine kinase n=1 Tax=Viridibacterium curvum TaxID=1101404 RepID=A0ABP9R3S5_9RHOO